jgi:hypothetical protein
VPMTGVSARSIGARMSALHLAVARLDTTRNAILAVLLALVAIAVLAVGAVTSVLLLVGGDVEPVARGLLWVGDIRWRR